MSDPINQFGHQAATLVLSSVRALPAAQRGAALEHLFGILDPKLAGRVWRRRAELEGAGVAPGPALEQAMATSMAQGLVEQFVRAARGHEGAAGHAMGYCAMSGWTDKLKDIGKAVLTYSNPFTAQADLGRRFFGSSTGKQVLDWAGSAAGAIGKLGCKVASHPVGQIAAAGGAGVAGAPPQAGLVGAQVVSAVCNPPKPSPLPGVLPPGTPEWVVPAAFAGGAVILYLLLR